MSLNLIVLDGCGVSDGLGSYITNSPNQTRANDLCLNWVRPQAILVPFPQPKHLRIQTICSVMDCGCSSFCQRLNIQMNLTFKHVASTFLIMKPKLSQTSKTGWETTKEEECLFDSGFSVFYHLREFILHQRKSRVPRNTGYEGQTSLFLFSYLHIFQK